MHSVRIIFCFGLLIRKLSFSVANDLFYQLHQIEHNHTHLHLGNYSKVYFPIPKMISCCSEFGEEGKEPCQGLHLKMPKFSLELLYDALKAEDSNNLLRRIYISIRQHPQDPSSSTTAIGAALDTFITPRPWWMVLKEVAVDPRKSNHTLSSTAEGNAAKSAHFVFNIFLARHSPLLEPMLRMIAGVQYPPPEVCEQTRMQVGHMVNAGWGSHLAMYGGNMGDHLWNVFEIYDSNTNTAAETVAYSSGSTCPTIVNKRRCAFLPLTNCTIPSFLAQAPPDDFQHNKDKYWSGDFSLYTNASAVGVRIVNGPNFPNLPQNAYQQKLFDLYWAKANNGDKYTFKTNRFIEGHTKELNSQVQGTGYDRPYIRYTLTAYGFMQRSNVLYRSMIADRIEAFRQNQSFPADTVCTAVHIRRGDRTVQGVNITEYCSDHFRPQGKSECQDRHGNPADCGGAGDLGCWTAHPFGALRLQDYLDRAWKLQQTRNVFVMTDDGDWLEREKATVDKDWNVVGFAGERFSGNSGHGNGDRQTDNGVDFLASVVVARQCKAFVGHWGSAVSFHVFYSMCIQHADTVGQCPPTCNIAGFY